MAAAEPWNDRAARILRSVAYQPDGIEPAKGVLSRDIQWWRFRLQVYGDSPDRIEQAIRGLPLVVRKIGTGKYSPAKLCSKKGPWANLFELSVTAAGRVRTVKPGTSQMFARILRGLASQAG